MKTSTMLTPHLELIEKRLEELIPAIDSPHALLYEAARYSLLLPAKRFRPLLVLAVLEDFGAPLEWGVDPACALELIHTYSLIHDDLPCMDDDDMRRGKPTLHKVYGEAEAVLAGDYLLTYAFEILSKAPHLSAEMKLNLITLLSYRGGGEGMIGGQMIDIQHEGKSITSDTLKVMFAKKTGALIATALEFGALISEATLEDQNHLKKAGFALGIGYQYIDDLLDVVGNEKEMGKTPGSDRNKDKATSLTLHSLQEVRDKAHAYFSEALAELALLSKPSEKVLTLFKLIFHRSK